MADNSEEQIRNIFEKWHEYSKARDAHGLTSIYAPDATFESPAVVALYKDREDGVLRGNIEIGRFLEAVFLALQSDFGELYRTGVYFTNGRLLMWEYPRRTPTGQQADLVESMDIVDGLIANHRVYWGWRGFGALVSASAKK